MSNMKDLLSAIAAEDTVVDSAVVMLNGITGNVAALATPTEANPVIVPAMATAINNLVTDIQTHTANLTAAMVVNTPVVPTPVVVPVPVIPVVTPAEAASAANTAVSNNTPTVVASSVTPASAALLPVVSASTPWSASVSYNLKQVVSMNGNTYTSTMDKNLGNNPVTSVPGQFWTKN